ncbi:C2H2-type zinc finger transcription factor [Phycomyces blakesleeanus]|uniref:C2H2-type zinc finger transcription factor n=2 Tax=Phycomyces blakesleeanus TaxID=4837 RepID=A0A162UIX0_PHYB8|nr:C2H2-type zinc finger transcription factor [Phycomyces blakesleeanus NRRL 1555(-)]OAD75583.1 C2H2-type zinc finger transcription factor [Phycomyces blakesleeanus NRRL 1555(-)]|eukprot:XP_018293623.1 C2H2-type zinc finger transcription factor [Phycomyces blakesleeanus NRRL 1555(-)]
MTLLPLNDPTLGASNINIFLPLDLVPFGLEKLDRSGLVNLKILPSPVATTVGGAGTTKPADSKVNDLYCKPCKKKFSNEATWQNHIKSAKHIANQKKAGKVQPIPQTQKITVEDDPLIVDALFKIEQANKKKVSDPDTATSEYWEISKVLYHLQQPQKTADVLEELIQLTTDLKWKDTHHSAKLALSRLLCLYNKDFGNLSKARQLMLDTVEVQLSICHLELLNVAQQCDREDVATLLSESRKLVTKYLADNSKRSDLVRLVLETSSLFAQNKRPEEKEEGGQNIGIVMGFLAVHLSASVEMKQKNMGRVGELFRIMGSVHRTLDARLLKGELGLDCGTSEQLKESLWDVADTLLVTLEAEDYVRAKIIEERLGNIGSYPDLELIMEISEAIRLLDVDRLKTQVSKLGYMGLLVSVGDEDLLMNQVGFSREYQLDILQRMRTLVAACQDL